MPTMPPKPAPSRDAAIAPAKSSPSTVSSETGWLPDCVYTGEKFETGLAFFADGSGKITRFSRDPGDLAAARRLSGQAALPGLVNGHSHAFQRILRGRVERRTKAARDTMVQWREARDQAAGLLTPEDVYDAARMAFLEMMLTGITCVGEFHVLHHQPNGDVWPEPNLLAEEVLRAAHDTGIRIALIKVAAANGGAARFLTPATERFLADAEALSGHVGKTFPGTEAWMGIGVQGLGTASIDYLKAVGNFAHSHRMRLHAPVSEQAADNEACLARHGSTPVSLLAKLGFLEKRFTAIHAVHISDDEIRMLGAAKATVCCCPTTERNLGEGAPPVEKLLAAGVAFSLGTDCQIQIDLLEDARLMEYGLRAERRQRAALAPDPAVPLFHAATVAGARSLGAPGGALEIGRPADFFTVGLHDPSIVGADPNSLLANIVFSLERRAIRDVWVGALQRVANGRHALHGPIIGRFADLQRRVWA